MKLSVAVSAILALASLAAAPARAGTCWASCNSEDCPSSNLIQKGDTATIRVDPSASSCEDRVGYGSHWYLKAGAIVNALDNSDLVVTVLGASDALPAERDTCFFKAMESVGKTAKTTRDVQISIECNNWWDDCPIRFLAEFACFVPCCWTYDQATQRYVVSCVDDTQRTAVIQNNMIGYTDAEMNRFEQVDMCPPPPPATPTAAPTTSTPARTPAPSPSQTFAATSFVNGLDKTFKRTAIGDACDVPIACDYRCARSYHVTVSSGVVTFAPPASIDGCDCYTLKGTYENEFAAYVSSRNMEFKYDTSDGAKMIADLGAACRYEYTEGEPARPFVAKEYVRQLVSPSACDLPATCSYMCSVGYKVDLVGDDKVTATPAVANPMAGCTCSTLSATIRDDGTAIGAADSTTYALTKTSDGITVDATVNGVTCRGMYSPGTYVANKSAQSGASTMQAVLWATVAASVLGVVLSSFGYTA